jgi:hypothetical protein
MKFKADESMKHYLKPTEFCDCTSNEIQQKAEELTKSASSTKEAAKNIFYFVRDQCLFTVGRSDVKASETLKIKEGYCITKTNLQIALLRAVQIPARYHQVVLDKEILKNLISNTFYKMMPQRIWFHPWCECYLSGKWIACDLFLDRDIYQAAVKHGYISKEKMPFLDWDGETDLKIATPWILEDVGTHSSYDEVSKKVVEDNKLPNFLVKLLFSFFNRYTKKLRKNA